MLADIVPPTVYGRAYGFERAMDNLGAIAGALLALVLVGLVGVRTAIALSIIPGLLAAAAIVYAIRHAPRAEEREQQPLRLWVRPVLRGRLGRLLVGVSAFESATWPPPCSRWRHLGWPLPTSWSGWCSPWSGCSRRVGLGRLAALSRPGRTRWR
jgi:MFS family permease